MAEGFLRKYAPKFDVISAGTAPKFQLNPRVVEEMISSSITVNMGCMDRDSCPSLFVKDVIDWNISDPKDKDIVHVREIRDKIKNEVLNLIKKLETQS